MTEPSIKGNTFDFVVADLHRAVDEGHIDRESLEARLPPGDLIYLDSEAKISSASLTRISPDSSLGSSASRKAARVTLSLSLVKILPKTGLTKSSNNSKTPPSGTNS